MTCVGKTMRCRSRSRSTSLIICAVPDKSSSTAFVSTDCRSKFDVLFSNAGALNKGTAILRPISSPCGELTSAYRKGYLLMRTSFWTSFSFKRLDIFLWELSNLKVCQTLPSKHHHRTYCFRSSPFPNDLMSRPADSMAANESFWDEPCFIFAEKNTNWLAMSRSPKNPRKFECNMFANFIAL